MNIDKDLIVVIDFGSPLNKVMTEKIREFNVYSELVSDTITAEELKNLQPKGIIFGASVSSVYTNRSPKPDPKIFDIDIPKLGICYGLQTIVHFYEGVVDNTKQNEFGMVEIEIGRKSKLLNGLPKHNHVHMSHGDRVKKVPEGFSVDARSPGCPIAAISKEDEQIFGLQFHPEMKATKNGNDVLRNFLFDICHCEPNWTMENFFRQAIDDIRYQVEDERVILPVSGGVKSTVLAALVHQAIGDRLVCVFVNNGLLRQNEPEEATEILKERFGIQPIYLEEVHSYIENLSDIRKRSEKEKVVHNQLTNLLQRELSQMEDVHWFASSLLYSEWLKSKSESENGLDDPAKVLHLKSLEPLINLYDHEIRELGRLMRIPEYILNQQPFPASGLAGRIKGEVSEHKLKILRHSEEILQSEFFQAGLSGEIYQYYAVLLDEDVDEAGQADSTKHSIAIRTVEWVNAVETDWAKLPYKRMERISKRISNEVTDVSHVYYDITTEPPTDH